MDGTDTSGSWYHKGFLIPEPEMTLHFIGCHINTCFQFKDWFPCLKKYSKLLLSASIRFLVDTESLSLLENGVRFQGTLFTIHPMNFMGLDLNLKSMGLSDSKGLPSPTSDASCPRWWGQSGSRRKCVQFCMGQYQYSFDVENWPNPDSFVKD